jgi:hypothetical protein
VFHASPRLRGHLRARLAGALRTLPEPPAAEAGVEAVARVRAAELVALIATEANVEELYRISDLLDAWAAGARTRHELLYRSTVARSAAGRLDQELNRRLSAGPPGPA